MDEIFKDINGFADYQISSCGTLKSFKKGKERILIPHIDNRGYLRVALSKDGKQYTMKVHRLVAQHFIPNPNNLPEVNHKNECKTDNRVENLEWVSHIQNTRYGTRSKRIAEKNRIVQRNDKTKSKVVLQYSLDGEFIKEWQSTNEIKRQLGFGHISECCNGKYKQMYGFIWRYKNEE